MKYQAGQSGNLGGRPKGSCGGRMQALQLLDKILGKRKSQRGLTDALEKELERDALGFFKTIVMPLLPKESKLSVENDGILEWKSLVEAFPKPEVPAAPPSEE